MSVKSGILFQDVENVGKPFPIPFDNIRWGKPLWWKERIPGVYEFETDHDAGLLVVDKTKVNCRFTEHVLNYGISYHDNMYVYFDYDNGRDILSYEILLFLLSKKGLGNNKDLLDEIMLNSLYGAEKYPIYFGEWTPQTLTPWGRRSRYITFSPGIWFVQSVSGVWSLSLNYVQYSSLSTDLWTLALGNPGVYPEFTFDDLFWSLDNCAPVILCLLSLGYDELKNIITSVNDLMCYLHLKFPDYLQKHLNNTNEDITWIFPQAEENCQQFLRFPENE